MVRNRSARPSSSAKAAAAETRSEDRQRPRSDRHRTLRLEDTQHAEEARRTSQVGDQQSAGNRGSRRRDVAAIARQSHGRVQSSARPRRAPLPIRRTAGKEVWRNFPRPRRLLQQRNAVVAGFRRSHGKRRAGGTNCPERRPGLSLRLRGESRTGRFSRARSMYSVVGRCTGSLIVLRSPERRTDAAEQQQSGSDGGAGPPGLADTWSGLPDSAADCTAADRRAR